MVKINFSRCKTGGLLVLLMTTLPLYAQDKDFASWMNLGVEYKLNPVIDLMGGVEWRTKDNLSKTDRWGMDVGASYKALSFLKLGAGYELHYRNRGDAGWKFRHRYYVDGTLSAGIQRIKLSLRERLQHTLDATSDEYRLRSRLKVAYDVPKSQWEPYVSVEMYNGLNSGDRFGVKRMRYRGGLSLPLCRYWEADVFYCRQWEDDGQKNIFGIEAVYTF